MKKFKIIDKALEGIGSLLFLFPEKNKSKITLPDKPISVSLKNDWEKIGADMWQALKKIEPNDQSRSISNPEAPNE